MKIRGNTVTTTQKQPKSLLLTGGKMEGAVDMNLQELTNLRTPVNERDAANKKYVDDKKTEAITDATVRSNQYTDNKAKSLLTNKSNATLTAAGWSAAAPYTQVITVEGLSDKKFVKVYPVWPASLKEKLALSEETAKVRSCERTGNTMTFQCWEEKPALDIPIAVEVYV